MKHFLSVLLSICMLMGTTLPVRANEDALPEEDLPTEEVFVSEETEGSEEEVFEQEEYAVVPKVTEYKIYVDGKEVPGEPGYLYDEYEFYYRYTSVAEALGFTVYFDAETGMVHTDGENISYTFDTTASTGTSTQNGETEELGYWPLYYFTNIEDKMYINAYGLGNVLAGYTELEFCVNDETHDIFIYTPDGKRALAEELNKKLTVFNRIQAETRDKDYLSDGLTELSLNIKSDFFDIEGNGTTKIQISSAKLGKKIYSKIHTEGKGLMNLLSLFSFLGNTEAPAKFPDTSDIEIYFEGTQLYIKGEQQVRQLIQAEDYSLIYDFPEETDAVAKQWVCVEDMPEGYKALLQDGDFGTYLVECAFTAGGVGKSEDILALYEALFGDENFTVTENAKGTSYTYTLNKDAFLSALEPYFAEMDEEERAAFDKQMELFGCDLTVKEDFTKDGGTNRAEASISISNIENPWNEQMLSLQISLQSSGTYEFSGVESFVFPDVSQAVNLRTFAEEMYEKAAESELIDE